MPLLTTWLMRWGVTMSKLGIVWRPFDGPLKYLAPSGETWLRRSFQRTIDWEIYGKKHYKALAKLLQVPPDLLRTDRVIITIDAERNVSSGKFRDKRRVLKG